MRKKQIKHKYGSALIIVVITMILFLIIGGGLLQLGLGKRILSANRTAETIARCAADSGIEEGLALRNVNILSAGPFTGVANKALPYCDAKYTITYPDANGYTITSVGVSNNNRATRTVNVLLRLKGLWEFGVFAEDSITMRTGSVIDTWANGAPSTTLQIGTNDSSVSIKSGKNGATVDGDFYLGYGSDPATLAGNSAIEGTVYSLPAPIVLDSVEEPEINNVYSAIETNFTVPANVSAMQVPYISLGNAEILTIDHPVTIYATGAGSPGGKAVELNNGATLDIKSGGSLILYVGASQVILKNSTISGSDPTKFKLFGLDTCTKIQIDNCANVYSAIYAPKADVTVINSADVYGGIVGSTVTLDNSASVHYDAYLKFVTIYDVGAKFVIKRWQEL